MMNSTCQLTHPSTHPRLDEFLCDVLFRVVFLFLLRGVWRPWHTILRFWPACQFSIYCISMHIHDHTWYAGLALLVFCSAF